MAQQTAVEYYADKQLELHQKLKDNQLSGIDFITQSRDLLIESKEMEKQQIVNAHLTGLIHPLEIEATKQAEQYYTETYKKD
jgi:hypothetical protein